MQAMVLEVLAPGPGCSIQDPGRPGWRHFGVPTSGAMDRHAAGWANQLLGNPPGAPVLELLLHGARLRVLVSGWLAFSGAGNPAGFPAWSAVRLTAGTVLDFPVTASGLWTYVAVPGGFATPRWMDSASVYARGGIGAQLAAGDPLPAPLDVRGATPIATRSVAPAFRRAYETPPALGFWPGCQWEEFSGADRDSFLARPWIVSSRSDRAGYRLSGTRLTPPARSLISEPVVVGAVQVPPDGDPVVLMRDGPTVGGYPKLGVVEPGDLDWLAQIRPGQAVRWTVRAAGCPA